MADITMRILLSAVGGAQVSSAISGVASSLSALPGPMGAIAGVGLAVGAAVVGIGVASVNMAASYEASMNKVQALTGASNQQMKGYDGQLKELAVNAGVAPKALADGLYNVISAGYKGGDAMKVLTLATEDSKIGMTSAAVTSDALTNVLASFSLGAKDATRVNGEMLQTVTLGKSTFEQYATSIVKSASSASQFHVSMETMNAAFATMTSSGIRAAQASTDFQQSLKVMYGNIGTVTKSLEKSGIAFDEAKFNTLDYGGKVQMLNAALQEANAKHVKVTGVTLQAAQAISTIAQHIKTYNSDLASLSDKQAMAQKTQEAWAITQNGFKQQMSRLSAAVQVLFINIGQQLLPVLTKIAGAVIPIVVQFASWITSANGLSGAMSWFGGIVKQVQGYLKSDAFQHALADFQTLATQIGQVLLPVMQRLGAIAQQLMSGALSGIGHLFTSVLIPAADNVAHAISLIIGPTHGAGTALAGVAPFAQRVGSILQGVGVFLATTFKPIWDQLVATFNGEVKPAWTSLVQAIQPLLPQLQKFAQFIGIVVGGALVLLISIIGGVLHGLSSFLSGVVSIIGGVVSVITGAVKIISGIIAVIVDIFTGNFGKLKTDFGTIMDGIGTIAHGVWEIIKGVFQAGIGFVVGFVKGFVDTIVGIFHNLSNILVGHSIIPDMVNAIVQWIAQLPGRVMAFLTQLLSVAVSLFTALYSAAILKAQQIVSGILNWIGQLPGRVGAYINELYNVATNLLTALVSAGLMKAQQFVEGIFQWIQQAPGRVGSILNELPGIVTGALGTAASAALSGGMNIVNSIADGIRSAIGAVGDAIGQVTSFISAHLPHSPAKIGPLKTLPQVGPEIVRQISDGMVSATPYLQNALRQVLSPITATPTAVAVSSTSGIHSADSGVLADQLSFAHPVTDIYRGKKKPVDTRAERQREAAQARASRTAVANDFKGIDAEIKAIQKREAEKIKHERDVYNAEIKAIEARDKHLRGSAKKAEEAQIKAIREHEKLQIANERQAFEAKIRADRAKEKQMKQQITLQLHIHADSLTQEREMQRIAEYAIKHFGEQIREQFGSI